MHMSNYTTKEYTPKTVHAPHWMILPIIGNTAVFCWFMLFVLKHVIPSIRSFVIERLADEAELRYIAERDLRRGERRVARVERVAAGLPVGSISDSTVSTSRRVQAADEDDTTLALTGTSSFGLNMLDERSSFAASRAGVDPVLYESARFFYSQSALPRAASVTISVNNNVISFCDASAHAEQDDDVSSDGTLNVVWDDDSETSVDYGEMTGVVISNPVIT